MYFKLRCAQHCIAAAGVEAKPQKKEVLANAYLRFCQQEQPIVKQQQPHLGLGQIELRQLDANGLMASHMTLCTC